MARILARFRVFPKTVDVDLKRLRSLIEAALPGDARVEGAAEEPIAFGLKALILGVSFPEEDGGWMDRVEEAIKGVQGVGEIQVLAVSRAR